MALSCFRARQMSGPAGLSEATSTRTGGPQLAVSMSSRGLANDLVFVGQERSGLDYFPLSNNKSEKLLREI